MDINNDAKEYIAKKMKTIVAPMTEVLQIPPLEDNSEKNLENLGESSVTLKNPTITSPDSLNKTKQKIFPGPMPANTGKNTASYSRASQQKTTYEWKDQ
ncbi:541_t:CDS:2, partial [Gigaspora margarita]